MSDPWEASSPGRLNATATAMIAALPANPARLEGQQLTALGGLLREISVVTRECADRGEFFNDLMMERGATPNDERFAPYLTVQERAELDASIGRALDADQARCSIEAWLRGEGMRDALEMATGIVMPDSGLTEQEQDYPGRNGPDARTAAIRPIAHRRAPSLGAMSDTVYVAQA
jgi:hypothetical protein